MQNELKQNNMAYMRQEHGLTVSKRGITKIIVHCSATPDGRDVTAADIRKWHMAKDWMDIGYHYVIRLDGTVEEGRNINLSGAHTKGYNAGSIGICYIGGCDENLEPKDTRTEPQMYALYNLLKDLTKVYKNASLHGHNEFSRKACPSFSVKDEYNSLTLKQEYKMADEFKMDDSFADFVNDLTDDKANDNAVCGIDDDDCEACGA